MIDRRDDKNVEVQESKETVRADGKTKNVVVQQLYQTSGCI